MLYIYILTRMKEVLEGGSARGEMTSGRRRADGGRLGDEETN
jgi:hypothetical protein